MWPDNETAVDLIGFRVHADLIRELVRDESLLPLTIGVFGDWGNGKSSIMEMLRADLEPLEKDGLATLYFNGWLFEGYDDAKAALLGSILEDLARNKTFGAKFKENVGGLLKRVQWMRLMKWGVKELGSTAMLGALTGPPGIATAMGVAAAKVGSAVVSGDKELTEALGTVEKPEDMHQSIRNFREDFERLLQDAGIKQLVVLIDDLDRCSPERIVDNLEAIKLFLNVKGSAFVIGADPRIVRQAIAIRYGRGFDAAQEAGLAATAGDRQQIIGNYLEKVIQIPYHLPRLAPHEVEIYLNLLFCRRALPSEDFAKCLEACNQLRSGNRYTKFSTTEIGKALGRDVPDELRARLEITNVGGKLISEGLKGNPRQVKRFLNAFLLRCRLANAAQFKHFRPEIMIKLMILEYTDPIRFRELYEMQNSMEDRDTFLSALEEMAKNSTLDANASEKVKSWNGDRLLKWARLEPLLGKEDLSDYFWLARDKLESQISSDNLVPPVIRNVHNLLLQKIHRPTGVDEAAKFEGHELDMLFGLLERTILQSPEDGEAYDAFMRMIRKGVVSSNTAYLKILKKVEPRRLPPAPGLALVSLNDPIFADFVRDITTNHSSTGFAKAIAKAAKK
jgi:predicted KAP-like P-loop ATPase